MISTSNVTILARHEDFSDPVEKNFSQYRAMIECGQIFSQPHICEPFEKILNCFPILKQRVDYWQETVSETDEESKLLLDELEEHEYEMMDIQLCEESSQEAHCIAGGMAKKDAQEFKM